LIKKSQIYFFDLSFNRNPRRDIPLVCITSRMHSWSLSRKDLVSISSTFLRTNFSYNIVLPAFSSYVLALMPKFRTKNTRVNVDEIDGRTKPEVFDASHANDHDPNCSLLWGRNNCILVRQN
jgi:hypothetical protein